MRTRGFFLSFEGTEGSGKSTQIRLLVERLRADGQTVVLNQEPGGTEIGKQIRRVLLDPANTGMTSMTELLLMFASRCQATKNVIEPALQRGEVVISDRFTDSSLAYQGDARGMGWDTVLALHRLSVGELMPDMTICLEVDVMLGLERAHKRNQTSSRNQNEARMDRQSLSFHEQVGRAYRRIHEAEPGRFQLVDGSGEPGKVAKRVWELVKPAIVDRLRPAKV
jgi:dTMP kinase